MDHELAVRLDRIIYELQTLNQALLQEEPEEEKPVRTTNTIIKDRAP